MEVLRRAEALQALAVQNIRVLYDTGEDDLTLETLTWERYVKELEAASKNGTIDQFEEKLRNLLMPVITAVMSGPEATT